MARAQQIVRKSEFATLTGVTRGRVSQWIAAGKIGREAIIGQGRHARINVAIARRHLRERLSPAHRFGLNGLKTKLGDAPQEEHSDVPSPPSIERRIKQEKLRQAELTTIRAEERDRLARGTYILAAAAKEENGRLASKLFEAFDGSLIDFAAALSARYKLPARDVLHLLRAQMVLVRERVSSEYAALAAAEPATIPDDESRDEALH
jgi:hypothetical protein